MSIGNQQILRVSYNRHVTNLAKFVGKRIRAARLSQNLTQAELGDYLGITRDAVSKIELGNSTLTLQNLEKLPAILDRPISYFLGLEIPSLSNDESEVIHLYRALSDEARRLALATLRAWLRPESSPPVPQVKPITAAPELPPGVDRELFERVEKVMSLLTPDERYLLGKMILDRRAARLGASSEGVEAEILNSE